MAYIKDLHTTSRPAENCKDPTYVTTTPLTCVEITLPVIRRNTLPTTIGLSPEFLSSYVKRHARNASKDHDRFSALHNIVALSPNWVDVNNFFQPPASSPNDPAHPLCFFITYFNKKLTVTRHCIFWCTWESTSKNHPKSQLDIGIFILNIIHYSISFKTQSKFFRVVETYINKRAS